MRTAGIICEYNPFHPGHRLQIQRTREQLGEDTAILCLMSGNYVQRGEPAIYDKWTRAEAAVCGGADLVLELPLTAAVNAAGYFAAGAVSCMDALGCVDYLSFGSESGNLEVLRQTALLMSTAAYEEALRQALSGGVSYARAREEALRTLGGSGACLATPNNALGVDYLRCLMEQGSAIQPLTVPREMTLPTASDLRRQLTAEGTASGPVLHTIFYGERAMLGTLKRLEEVQFRQMPFGSEGLWSKVMKACRTEMTLEDIILACKSKRYTYSRLRRMLLCLFLGLDGEDMTRPVPYLRVLGFNDRGRQLLRSIRQTSKLPVVSGAVPDTPEAGAYFALEARATDLYGLFAPPGVVEPSGREKSMPPVYVRENAES